MRFGPHLLALAFMGFCPTPGQADVITLEEFVESVDRTPVTFEGRIRYDPSDREFFFYDQNRDGFGVSLDAGRDSREQVEQECELGGFFVQFDKMCIISASGTVEIRGGRVFLSIEEVLGLTAPN